VDAIVAGEVERVLIAHQDRLARFGFALIKHLCETHHTELVMMNYEAAPALLSTDFCLAMSPGLIPV